MYHQTQQIYGKFSFVSCCADTAACTTLPVLSSALQLANGSAMDASLEQLPVSLLTWYAAIVLHMYD